MSSVSPIGVDVGGTFTDCVRVEEEAVQVHKTATTSPQHEGVATGIGALEAPADAAVLHGTTVATNALLEQAGARTALVTTAGFGDVLALGRQDRPALYDLSPRMPPPLVPPDRRFEVPERIDADGAVQQPLDTDAVVAVADRLREHDVESVAVVFLFSFRNATHERKAADLLRERLPAVPVTCSADLLPEHREYERMATTVANAYVRPVVARYLDRVQTAVGGRSVHVMQSNGGIIPADRASTEAARLALSGPAGGVVGAMAVARQALDADAPRLLTLDMGGTSTDVALCDGAVPHTAEGQVAGLPLRLPSIDIHTVGAGGGSLARVDAGGSLRVGPESAGAAPGPACYGRGGTRPTVTDAHAVLGRLTADYALGSGIDFDAAAARAAFEGLADALGRTAPEAAQGVLQVANTSMEQALRRVSVERGHDPRDYALMPFGGAGPMHACALADALGITRVLVPPAPGTLSALGLLLAERRTDAAQALLQPLEALRDDPTPLRKAADRLADHVADRLGTPAERALELDLRYAGQSYELTVPLAAPTREALVDAADAFHAAHRQRYTYARPEASVEAVALRLQGRRPGAGIRLPTEPETETPVTAAQVGTRPVGFEGGDAAEAGPSAPAGSEAAIYRRDALRHGHAFNGPAVVHQYDSTVVVPPGWSARVDRCRLLRLTRRAD
jgi:N-methylhydantoinase A